MTRQELIQSVEKHIAETESDLAVSRQALILLRGSVVKLGKLKDGPIVYGNGHGGARKKDPKTSPQTEVRAALTAIMKTHPQGMEIADMRKSLAQKGFTLTSHTIHNCLRCMEVTKPEGTGKRKLYALK